MIKAINILATEWFTPDSDPDKGTDNATAFKLRALDSYVMAHIQDGLAEVTPDAETGAATTSINVHATALEAAAFAIEDYRNFPTPIKHVKRTIGRESYPVLAKEVLATIPINVVMEIYRRVREMNEPTKEDVKNSGAQS